MGFFFGGGARTIRGRLRSRNPHAGPTNWPFRKPMSTGGVVWKGACAMCPSAEKILTLILIIFKVNSRIYIKILLLGELGLGEMGGH